MTPADETSLLLQEWSKWIWTNRGINLGFPNMTPVRRLQGSTVPNPLISDAVASEVDLAVSKLCSRDKEMGRVLVMHFVQQYSVRQLARKLHQPLDLTSGLLNAGVAWVSDELDAD